MVCAIENAGFEIRDQIQWLYGSGFPKSHDVSKGIDRAAGAKREIVGRRKHPTLVDSTKIEEQANAAHGGNTWEREWDISAPATDAASQWEGWGTALKPASEPIVLARKPLEGTVAQNVLKWGVGALNTDGCRIEAEDKTPAQTEIWWYEIGPAGHSGVRDRSSDHLGRWPANVIHDGSEEVIAGFPETISHGGGRLLTVEHSEMVRLFQMTQQWSVLLVILALPPASFLRRQGRQRRPHRLQAPDRQAHRPHALPCKARHAA